MANRIISYEIQDATEISMESDGTIHFGIHGEETATFENLERFREYVHEIVDVLALIEKEKGT